MTQVDPAQLLSGSIHLPSPSAQRFYTRSIGSSELRVFPIALSGKTFGSAVDEIVATSILDSFVEGGGNFIDTADSYASGQSERLIGEWMRARQNRDDIVLATKIGKSLENPGMGVEAVTRSVDASLDRLGISHIDLLYLHIDDESVDFEETLLAVDTLITQGKVRYFGGSDHTGNRLVQARIACGQMGVAPMAAVQTQYNLLHRHEYETGLAHVAAIQGLGVMPRFALARGFLSGKYRRRANLTRSPRSEELAKYFRRQSLKVVRVLDKVADEQDESVATIALAWLLHKPGVVAPVVSSSRAEQVFDLIAAPAVQLTRHQLADLNRVSGYKSRDVIA